MRRGVRLSLVDEVLAEHDLDYWLADDVEDTDVRNSRIALAALCLLKRNNCCFASLDLHNAAIHTALMCRPACRWEKRIVTVTIPTTTYTTTSQLVAGSSSGARLAPVDVECVMDVGHNPAAISALAQRIVKDYSKRPVRFQHVTSSKFVIND